MKRLLISGYRSYELNIFDKTDPKYKYLKKFLQIKIKGFIEKGVEWFIINGQLGIELWVGEIIIEFKDEFPNIHLGIILPYSSFESNWNDENQGLFNRVTQKADYVDYTSKKPYESPEQIKNNQIFTIRNTDGAFLIYDRMNEESASGKPKYLYDLIKLYKHQQEYELLLASFEEIDFFIQEDQELNESRYT